MARHPVATYRDGQRNRALYRRARQIAGGILTFALAWIMAVIIMSGGGTQ